MSVINDYQVNGLFPSKVGGTGTAIKYFPRLLGSSIGVAPATPSATNATGQLAVPGNSELNGALWKVSLGANVLDFTGGTTYNFILQANVGSIASPSYTTIASTGLIGAAAATPVVVAFKVNLQGDTASGNVAGFYTAVANNVVVKNNVALDAQLTGINFNAAPSTQNPQVGNATPFGLVAGVLFSTSVAGNAASLYQFQISAE